MMKSSAYIQTFTIHQNMFHTFDFLMVHIKQCKLDYAFMGLIQIRSDHQDYPTTTVSPVTRSGITVIGQYSATSVSISVMI